MKAKDTLTAPTREHYGWVDALRVGACVLVVLAHACDAFVGAFDSDRTSFLTGVAIGSLTRSCVPLFVMITATVLLPLPREATLGGFYRKRLGRLVVPLVFWSLALPVAMWAYYNYGCPTTANPMLAADAYTPAALLNKLTLWLVNFNFDTTPLWYLYMLAGLYLVIPIIDAWLQTARKRDVELLLCLWLGAMLLPWVELFAPAVGYQGVFGNMGVLGECDWNPFGLFYYVSGFGGYVVLTHYLRTWPLQWSGRKLAAVGTVMFAVGYAITFGGFVLIQEYYPGDYRYLEKIWYFCGLNVWMMTVVVYVWAQRLRASACRPWLRRLAGLTFGIYLCHFPLEYVTYDWLDIPALAPWARILAGAALTFVMAAALCWLLSRWKPTRRLIA